ncbi:element excision factor XisH family protein [Haliscomenobacter sp.]|uniref:element excision factor XisH family protein n=1 Tax=Haliscomenobacter sp. TaxID=2717303 RepID=UPI003BA96ADC
MARDKFHSNAREALVKEGWNITDDPLRIPIDGSYLEIDLAAEKVFAAEREGQKIAVEVKSFLNKSFMADFHEAMGQYLDYRSALEDVEPDREVYLAVPESAFGHYMFQGRFIQKRLKEENACLIIFNSLQNTIIKWIKY